MDISEVVEDFGDMPETFKDCCMRTKYKGRDKDLLKDFCEQYKKKLVKIGVLCGSEPLYFFEGDTKGYTRRDIVISLQGKKATARR